MNKFVYLNGKKVNPDEACLNIYDHGFLYGDGAFEGIRVYNRRVFRLAEHIARLYRSLNALGINLSMEPESFCDSVLDTVASNKVESGYIRVTVSRGVGLGLDPKHMIDAPPTIVISTEQLSLYHASMYQHGLEVITASTRVPPPVCIDPQIKSLGRYINNIAAKMEANRVGAGEALMLNMQGYVAEATGDNIFIVADGKLKTPPTSQGALPGITRAAVMDCANELGFPCEESVITLYDCYSADESFLSGTAAEVIPMVKLDGRNIGEGKPGVITNRLIEEFHKRTQTDGPLAW